MVQDMIYFLATLSIMYICTHYWLLYCAV